MKVNMTSTFTDQAEVHRGDGSESGDPTMAFLAALGGMLAGPLPVATTPGVPADAAAALAKAAAGSVDAKAGVPAVLAAGVTVSAEAILAGTSSTPTKAQGQPMIAADRAGSPVAGGAPGQVATPKELAALSVDALMSHVITTTSQIPDPAAALAKLTNATGQPVVAADRAGVAIVNPPIASPTITNPPIAAVAADKPFPPSATLPAAVAPTAELSVANPVAVALESNAAGSAPIVQAAAVQGAGPNALPKSPLEKAEARPIAPLTEEPKANAKTASNVSIATPAAVAPTPAAPVPAVTIPVAPTAPNPKANQEVDGEAAKAALLPELQTDHGPAHIKPLGSTATHTSTGQPDPALVSPALTQAPTRVENVKEVVTQAASHPEVAAQIAPALASFRHDPDGTHLMTVVLHPADLGQVQVVVEMRNGTIHLQLTGAHEAARDALTGALPQLRRELSDSGLTVGRTDVMSQDSGTAGSPMSGGGSGSGGWLAPGSGGSAGEERPVAVTVPEVALSQPKPAHAGGVDVTI